MLQASLQQLLLELEEYGRQNDARVGERRDKMLNLNRSTAELVFVLLQASGRRRVLEIGTSNGYSTIWLAAALRESKDARIVSVDRLPEKLAAARQNLQRAGLAHMVELVEGEANEVVRSLDGPFDCVLFDADRVTAPEQLKILLPKLAKNVLLLADNVLSHPEEIAAYKEMVERLPGFFSTVVPVGKGLQIAWRGKS